MKFKSYDCKRINTPRDWNSGVKFRHENIGTFWWEPSGGPIDSLRIQLPIDDYMFRIPVCLIDWTGTGKPEPIRWNGDLEKPTLFSPIEDVNWIDDIVLWHGYLIEGKLIELET